MQDHELYRRILGIEAAWYVDSVELKLEVGGIRLCWVRIESFRPNRER
jgi:hypothetical protein